jgi:hypothetical protein
VRAHLLGANEIMEEFSRLDGRKVDGVVLALEWVLVDSIGGCFVDYLLFVLDCRKFIIETLDELVVFALKLNVVLLGNLISRRESELRECGV